MVHAVVIGQNLHHVFRFSEDFYGICVRDQSLQSAIYKSKPIRFLPESFIRFKTDFPWNLFIVANYLIDQYEEK